MNGVATARVAAGLIIKLNVASVDSDESSALKRRVRDFSPGRLVN